VNRFKRAIFSDSLEIVPFILLLASFQMSYSLEAKKEDESTQLETGLCVLAFH
jgi:hypothetical protein